MSWIFRFQKFYWLMGSVDPRYITCQISLKSVNPLPRYCNFFNFSRWQPSAILDLFVWGIFGPSTKVLGGLYHCATFGCYRCCSFENMKVGIFRTCGWKTLIRAPKIGVLEEFDPLSGQQYERIPRRHILSRVRFVSAIKREKSPTGLTRRWVPEKGGYR